MEASKKNGNALAEHATWIQIAAINTPYWRPTFLINRVKLIPLSDGKEVLSSLTTPLKPM